LLLRRDIKGGRLLGMEGTEALQVAPGFLQPQVFGNEIDEIQPVLDLLDRVLLHRGHRRKLTVSICGGMDDSAGSQNRQAQRGRGGAHPVVVRHQRPELRPQTHRRSKMDRIKRPKGGRLYRRGSFEQIVVGRDEVDVR